MSKSTPRKHPALGKLTQQQFLKRYWQKSPVLIRKAFDPFPDIISANELAGLACDERVESRLIIEKGGKTPWETRKGPFKPSLFAKLPKKGWTFLVNGVDRFLPGVQQILDCFSFIPFWRIDDVMFSYAVDQGNVGAHVDNYDVFLVQVHGTREWQIEEKAVLNDDFRPNLPIRLLKKFRATKKWILQPGDMLYLPPRFPHLGIARGEDCVTMSVGFRAPSHADLVNDLTTDALSRIDDKLRYSDPELSTQHPGEIAPAAFKRIRSLLMETLLDQAALEEWFGASVTELYPDVPLIGPSKSIPRPKLQKILKSGAYLVRAEGIRMAFIRQAKSAVKFFFGGKSISLSGKAAQMAVLLSGGMVIPGDQALPLLNDAKAFSLLDEMIKAGFILVEFD